MNSSCLQISAASRAMYAAWPDADLVAAAVEDDALAFAGLLSRHRDAVMRCIRRYVGGGEEAFDVLQETFISAWIALSQYEPDRPFEVWIRTIALNKCRDRSRRAAVRDAINRPWNSGASRDIEDSTPGPAGLLESEQALVRLQDCLAQLSSSLREPLLLTAIEGMSHLQAGDRLGISAKAVEMRVHRARERLEGLVRAANAG